MKQFALGTLVTTRDVHDKMTRDSQFAEFVLTCIARHKTCDWGDFVTVISVRMMKLSAPAMTVSFPLTNRPTIPTGTSGSSQNGIAL